LGDFTHIIDILFTEYSVGDIYRLTSFEKHTYMPAIKVNSNADTPSMVKMEIEKKKDQIKTLASNVLEGQEQFLDVYLLDMVRLQEAFMDDEDIA
jgi:hypothetical protein